MKTLSTFDAKNKFSKVLADAEAGEPTIITRNGKELAIVISLDDYRKEKRPSLAEFLLNSPLRGSRLDLTRSKDMGREPPDFS